MGGQQVCHPGLQLHQPGPQEPATFSFAPGRESRRFQRHQLGARSWQGPESEYDLGFRGSRGQAQYLHGQVAGELLVPSRLLRRELNRPVMIQFSEGGAAFAPWL